MAFTDRLLDRLPHWAKKDPAVRAVVETMSNAAQKVSDSDIPGPEFFVADAARAVLETDLRPPPGGKSRP